MKHPLTPFLQTIVLTDARWVQKFLIELAMFSRTVALRTKSHFPPSHGHGSCEVGSVSRHSKSTSLDAFSTGHVPGSCEVGSVSRQSKFTYLDAFSTGHDPGRCDVGSVSQRSKVSIADTDAATVADTWDARDRALNKERGVRKIGAIEAGQHARDTPAVLDNAPAKRQALAASRGSRTLTSERSSPAAAKSASSLIDPNLHVNSSFQSCVRFTR